jgi:hypothetical protein
MLEFKADSVSLSSYKNSHLAFYDTSSKWWRWSLHKFNCCSICICLAWYIIFWVSYYFKIKSIYGSLLTHYVHYVRLAALFFRVGSQRNLWPDGNGLSYLSRWLIVAIISDLIIHLILYLQCGFIPSCSYLFYYMVVYSVCWRFL